MKSLRRIAFASVCIVGLWACSGDSDVFSDGGPSGATSGSTSSSANNSSSSGMGGQFTTSSGVGGGGGGFTTSQTSVTTGGSNPCEAAPSDTPCFGCVKDQCCTELTACAVDEPCRCRLDCINNGQGQQCFQQCGQATEPWFGVIECANDQCGNECG